MHALGTRNRSERLHTKFLRAWFECGLSETFHRQGIQVASPIRDYLATLLAVFADTRRLTQKSRRRAAHRPLAYWETETGNAGSIRHRQTLQAMADLAVFADALGETVCGANGACDPLTLYERWQVSTSPSARDRLANLGLTPAPSAPSNLRH